MTGRSTHAGQADSGRRFHLAGFTVCLFVVLLLICSPSWAAFGKNKVQTRDLQWKTLYTPHFEIIHYDGADELAVRASIIAENAYREYANRLELEIPNRIPFILYASHADFAQTNIADALIGEGTGGFSEPLRNRMVLPYNGSHADFVHVIRHELVHIFMFAEIFNSQRRVGQTALFRVPLWYAEGIAEWLSTGWDGRADMFIRDATINDYVYPLERIGGFMVYKQGQAAMRLLSERYGPQKLVSFWRQVGRRRGVERALMSVYGLEMDDFNEMYRRALRKRYWPVYADREEMGDITRRLTDHFEDNSGYNERPALSPDGDLIAYFSARGGFPGIWLMSAIDGKVIRRLAEGHRSSQFESLHSFRSSLTFAPSGNEIAFVARSGNEETLHTVDIHSGRMTRSLRLGLDVASSPAWAPDGQSIVLVGSRNGRTDLYLVSLSEDGEISQLTDDVGDEAAPSWSPDGRRLAFEFNPRAEIQFEYELTGDGRRRLLWARPLGESDDDFCRRAPGGALLLLDLETGRRNLPCGRESGRHEPTWIDAGTLAVIDVRDGVSDLAVIRLDSTGTRMASEKLLTSILGGVSNPTYSAQADRLVVTGFSAGSYDLFAADDFRTSWSHREPKPARPGAVITETPLLVQGNAPRDTLYDRESVGLVEGFKAKLKLDPGGAMGGGVYFNSAVGLGVANVITFSDMLNDRRLQLLLNFYGSIDNSDLSASYFYLKRRIDLGVGIFNYSNFYNSSFTSVGEMLPGYSFFRERNYGLFGLASYPLDTFNRVDLEFQAFVSERTEYVRSMTSPGLLIDGDRHTSRLIQPAISFTRDTAYYGSHGPVTGSRHTFRYSHGVPMSETSLDRRTAVLDMRRYWQPWRRNTLAIRMTGATSGGENPRIFVIGGPWTLRGFSFYDYRTTRGLSGRNMFFSNIEYRLPLVDYLIFGWPARWGLTDIGATFFFDTGVAWNEQVRLLKHDPDGDVVCDELQVDYGIGLRTNFFFLPLKFDWAWRTDFQRKGDHIFQFSIGPEF